MGICLEILLKHFGPKKIRDYKAPHSWGFLFVGGWVDFVDYMMYDMRDKIIGLLALTVLVIGAIAYALFVEGAQGVFLTSPVYHLF